MASASETTKRSENMIATESAMTTETEAVEEEVVGHSLQGAALVSALLVVVEVEESVQHGCAPIGVLVATEAEADDKASKLSAVHLSPK
ncbi:hypothetical protein PHYBOEH_002839 [Phytophthora boehmeriae]|uniref:Uncharacterized protein n=1 Tax=Phytophthora boehmeriae TaxID=109152 RepID=A0A8T1WUX3_9STRA|nr:hypothetical protein PHYBOEH_002839 [Phytophthora boehmeriae]